MSIDLNTEVVRKKDIMHSIVDGEAVMLSSDLSEYLGLNETGTEIWELLEKRITVDKIVMVLMEHYDIEKKICEKEVIHYLNMLNDKDLIELYTK